MGGRGVERGGAVVRSYVCGCEGGKREKWNGGGGGEGLRLGLRLGTDMGLRRYG